MYNRDQTLKLKLIREWKFGCVFCGYNKHSSNGNSLLEAAHIQKYSNNNANDSINNLILLCPNHHTEYDAGIIDFDINGIIYCIDENDELNGKYVYKYPDYISIGNIKYHNQKMFIGSKMIK